jgi:hypothetical protein
MQSLHSSRAMAIDSSHRKQNLINTHSSHLSSWLTECTSHSSLQTIRTSNTQHLVDSDYVVRMNADAHVEGLFARNFDKVSRKVSLVMQMNFT